MRKNRVTFRVTFELAEGATVRDAKDYLIESVKDHPLNSLGTVMLKETVKVTRVLKPEP